MQITGTDELSLKVIKALNDGTAVKDIPSFFTISLDQAKRLSRYSTMLLKGERYLDEVSNNKLKKIGLKALYLSPLFKSEDWEGLVEILHSVDENTKRSELPILIKALQEKRERIAEFKKEVDNKLQLLEKRENKLSQLEIELVNTQQSISEQVTFLKKFPKVTQEFLLKHLGLYSDELVLSQRLDSNWQRKLKKKGILEYDEKDYIWYVRDLDKLAEDYYKRIKRKSPYPTEWDYEKEIKRNHLWGVPSNAKYRLPDGLAEDLSTALDSLEKQMDDIESERKTLNKQIKELRKSSPKSFIESVEAANTLSIKELKQHGELQDKALKWLYNKGYIVASEVMLPNGKRADVVGYNEKNHIIIVEVKVSKNDFSQDDKWDSYLNYCDSFYFLPNTQATPVYFSKGFRKKGIGLLREDKKSLCVEYEDTTKHPVTERQETILSINKLLSRKFIFGY